MHFSKLVTTAGCLLISFGLFAQGFEGSIHFTKSNMMDVTQYVYHVKDNMVRIDEKAEGSDDIVATLLVNLETEKMIALSYERNLYMKRPRKPGQFSASDGVVLEGKLKRSIHGMVCTQYRVKNKDADREIMYWVTDGDYAFFPKLMSILKRKDNFSTYYMNLPNLEGKFPLLAQENTLLREKKGFLQIDRLEEKELAEALFEIPDDFVAVER